MQYSNVQTDGSARATGKLMRDMVNAYYLDMAPYAHLGLLEIFDVIRSIPFRDDPPWAETLQRPYYTMTETGAGGDCDDKAIALASWAKLKGIPWRFVAVRRHDKKLLHHVALELYILNNWVPFDATYNFNPPGRWREHYSEYQII